LNKSSIEILNLRKNFSGYSVLKNITFSVKKNTIHGLLGKNGSGKSTIFKSICGLNTFEGKIFINGEDLKDNFNLKDNIGFIFTDFVFPSQMTVEDYFYSCSFLRDFSKENKKELFKKNSLFRFRNEKCNNLSTG